MTQADSGPDFSRADRIPGRTPSSATHNAVQQMFDRIAPRYALLNHILSFGLDFSWRRKFADHLEKCRQIEVLDLATGTGDLLISMLRRRDNIEKAVGLDVSENMLALCRKNMERAGLSDRVTLIQGDAARTALPDGGFDVVTMGFGIRNVPDPFQALSEIYRLLRQGGMALILEFSLPANRIIRSLYLVYLRHVVPFVGCLVSRDKTAYCYLKTTIESFCRECDLPALMQEAGFSNISAKALTLGTVSLYSALKP
ncbi:MAG: bifunctional demethylmenaquinone methyltransferase/2-methoxy-6-polyprenyl-1,4-benzoquinol methylase UbiE [Sedimentisphaerales bacterium]|nr:bifunctional demethylmenaquinone methyltransferase/2-methoxy-6-polyprenyl-1,4-benzoquinol methylase UbiE [Sedimentisphaerales bacterium]